jgi:hypothetical protein
LLLSTAEFSIFPQPVNMGGPGDEKRLADRCDGGLKPTLRDETRDPRGLQGAASAIQLDDLPVIVPFSQ